MWTPKNSDFGTLRAQKRIKFDAILIDFEDDGDKQCIEINALLSGELMLFQQFCCSGVGRYQLQAHLCIRATTFYALPAPLPRQVFSRSGSRARVLFQVLP